MVSDDVRSDYERFLMRKTQVGSDGGFAPVWMPDFLFDFQRHLVEWAIARMLGIRASTVYDVTSGRTWQHVKGATG